VLKTPIKSVKLWNWCKWKFCKSLFYNG